MSGNATADGFQPCRMTLRRYRIAYTPTEPDAEHESWLWEWVLDWVDSDPELFLAIHRSDDGSARRMRISIEMRGCPSRDRGQAFAMFDRLEEHAKDLRIQHHRLANRHLRN